MPSDRTQRLAARQLDLARTSSPTSGIAVGVGVTVSQLRNSRPHGLVEHVAHQRFALTGYQKLSW